MFAVFTMAIAVSFLYVGPAPLVPALNSYWIKIHVVAAITGSSLFALGGGVLTILFLVQDRARASSRWPRSARRSRRRSWADRSTSTRRPTSRPTPTSPRAAPTVTARACCPPAATLDRMAYRVIAFAFPIWTFAVIAGAIWAQSAWGRYWGWDPKETWSFVTWVIYAGYLHARSTSGWKGRPAAVIALVGFVSLLITYYAVNLWIVGLHSYKGF